ncbi:MAG: hypothetical protein ROW48_16240 [Bellilinea sp.]
MSLNLLDDTLNIQIFFEETDREYCDNICVRFWESCPEEEKLFVADETNLYITPDQARKIAAMLLAAVQQSETNCKS